MGGATQETSDWSLPCESHQVSAVKNNSLVRKLDMCVGLLFSMNSFHQTLHVFHSFFSYAYLPDLNIHFLCLCVLSFSSISGEEWPWPILLLLLWLLSLIVPEIQDSWGPWRPLRGGQTRISWIPEQKNPCPPWEGRGEPPHRSISYSWAIWSFKASTLVKTSVAFAPLVDKCGRFPFF